jgi:SAM-dependent methyltransferase
MEQADLYLMSNRDELARERLDALSALFDPVSQHRLVERGLRAGWRCWEVGAGRRSLVDWMSDLVGAQGRVVATDLEISGLAGPRPAWVEVLQADVGKDAPPEVPFDLIHARLVLTHVPERQRALEAMVASLAPGGVLVLEDADVSLQPLASLDDTEQGALANKVRRAFRELLTQREAELSVGRRLPRQLRELGLDDVQAEAWFPLVDERSQRIEQLTVGLLRGKLLAAGLLEVHELDEHQANLAHGLVSVVQPPLVGCWGRRS